jgi:hypothetical protein
MRNRIRDLYRAIERTEGHAATLSALLSARRAGYQNARGDALLRAHLESEIAYYVARQADVLAERDALRQQLMNERKAGNVE